MPRQLCRMHVSLTHGTLVDCVAQTSFAVVLFRGNDCVGTGVSPVQRWCYDGVSATVILSEGDSPSRRIPLAAKMRTWLNVILSELAWASESKNPFVASTAH